jgi:cyclophilin family peptidyl-prolyl cis-trans isomerase
MLVRVLFVSTLLIVLSLASSMAADAPPAAKSGSPSQTKGGLQVPAKGGPRAQEFYRLHGQLNALLGELAGLQVKYRSADEEKRAEIQQQWKEMIPKGEKMESKLIEAAEKAYAEAPNADPQITAFLINLLGRKVKRDDYEPAARIGKLLMENKCAEKQVPNLAGIAAFAVSDFDAAEKYLRQAEKAGLYQSAQDDQLAQIGEHYLHEVGRYKEAWAKEKEIRERETRADDLPQVLFKTNEGDIRIELFENQAPNTVANFISLVQKGFYNGLAFHRVLPGFMAQGGDPKGDGSGGPGYTIACECGRPDHRLHFRGSLSMAHRGRDTGGSQFFLTFVPTSHLDGKHTVFGRVIDGWDVLAKIQRRDPSDPEAPRPDKIVEAKVIRKRPHPYAPQKMPD